MREDVGIFVQLCGYFVSVTRALVKGKHAGSLVSAVCKVIAHTVVL